MNELTIGDKTYVSSKRAAEITGYAKDYIGQLCREGHVEARMVGRSWYVLEDSIRAHRFGKPVESVQENPAKEPEGLQVSAPVSWEPSKYTAESPQAIPTFVPVKAPEPVVAPQMSAVEMDEEEPALSEMQNAWKEWFQNKTTTPTVEEEPMPVPPRVVYPQEEEAPAQEEEAIPLTIQRIHDEPVREVPVPIRRAPEPVIQSAPVYAPVQRPVARRRRGSSLVTIALLLVIGGLAIVVAAIGTGYADAYVSDNPVMRFLGGTSTINK